MFILKNKIPPARQWGYYAEKLLLKFFFIIASIFVVSIIAFIINSIRIEYYIKDMPQLKSNNKHVILVHGLLSSSRAMRKINNSLVKNGYTVINFDYSSRKLSIREIAQNLDKTIQNELPKNYESLSFVTHSLGSIVVRYYLTHYKTERIKRFVMIAPPNHGSIWGRKLVSAIPQMKILLGIAGEEVKNNPDIRLPNPPQCEFGIIAGGFGNEFGLNPFIPGDNDFTVSVSETKLTGMNDHIVIKGQHTILLFQRRVIDNVISFLGTGKFIY